MTRVLPPPLVELTLPEFPGFTPDRHSFLFERGYLRGHHAEHPRDILALKARLLEMGGLGVVLAYREPHLEEILGRGLLLDGRYHVQDRGEPSRCHANTALLWENAPDRIGIMTGYALSDDGLWRQHSWAWHFQRGVVIETTLPRTAYFGVLLTDDEALAFAEAN